eukprot:11190005-Lingulodinium_polyedra.AAC.1
MYAVSMRKGQEGWVKCIRCKKWLSGPTCQRCFSSNHVYQVEQALIEWAVENGPADECYQPREEPEAGEERGMPKTTRLPDDEPPDMSILPPGADAA